MTVTDSDQARKHTGEKNISKYQLSELVSDENAAGVWLEFSSAGSLETRSGKSGFECTVPNFAADIDALALTIDHPAVRQAA
jgi:hypothetical protein